MLRSPKFYLPVILALILGAGVAAQLVCQIGNLEQPVGPPVPGIVQGDLAANSVRVGSTKGGRADPTVEGDYADEIEDLAEELQDEIDSLEHDCARLRKQVVMAGIRRTH